MTPLDPEKTLGLVRDLAFQAGVTIMNLRMNHLQQTRKADHSLVTNADHAADHFIREGLERAFPEHAILTEESGLEGPAGAEYLWVVDPLDGTKAYAKGIPGFSVMVGLLKGGKPLAGVVADPRSGYLYEAWRGRGTFLVLNGRHTRLTVSRRDIWEEMPLVVSTGCPEGRSLQLKALLPGPHLPPVNSVGIKVGQLVRQEADVYVNHHPVHYWDTCAPQVILEEAGGVFTLADGGPLRYTNLADPNHRKPTLASNGTRHAELVQKVGPLLLQK